MAEWRNHSSPEHFGRLRGASKMARLFRFVRLDDRFDTQTFTFLLPPTLVKEFSPDVYSRDFLYGHQKWSVSLVKSDKHVGSHITLKNASDGFSCTVDYSFTLLNSEHFTKNETFAERHCVFNADKYTNGRKTFIGLSDLSNRGFTQESGEFLLELELRNISTTFEQVIQLPRDNSKEPHSNAYQSKFETNYFTFGNYDWNLSVHPFGSRASDDGRPLVFLTRQTNFDHLCRVRYQVTLGQGDRVVGSDKLETIFDASGHGRPYSVACSLYNLTSSKGRLQLRTELSSVSAISEVQLCPLDRNKNRAHLYDRDKQAWMLETDLSMEYLKLRLYYADVRNVPRCYTRYVRWSLAVIPARGSPRPVRALGAPFSFFYSQADAEPEGFDMSTDIQVNEINDPDSVFLDEEGHRLTVHVEWLDSHLLFNDRYQRLDSVSSKQRHQMMREIMALQAENYSLEKQLYSYQVSIAKTSNHGDTRSQSTDEAGSMDAPVYPNNNTRSLTSLSLP